MKANSHIRNRIAGYLAGELDFEQEQEFLNEMQDNQLLKQEFERMKQTWDQFDNHPSGRFSDTGSAWSSLKERMDREGLLDDEPLRVRSLHTRRQYALRVAATIALVLAVGIPALIIGIRQSAQESNQFSYTAEKGIRSVDMPDGSRVFLNEGSSLSYDDQYTNRRNVTLRGEGYFEVMSDPARPFRVHAGPVKVMVLGTSFNVKTLPGNREAEVMVESGEVEVEMVDTREKLTLHRGDFARADGSLQRTAQQNANYLSWKTKDFKFVDESVTDILETLEKAYHVEVVANGLAMEELRLTTTYQEQSFDAILQTICAAFGMTYEKEGRTYTLRDQ